MVGCGPEFSLTSCLDGKRRRAAETGFSNCQIPAVLVATSTLEVGIDIGDVDIVGLVGPPPDVPALLQRVGRGGRRTEGTKVIPFAENPEHAAAIAGMLVSAASGNYEGGTRFRNWGVFAQQAASYIKQNSRKGRPKGALLDLAEAVWPSSDTREVAEQIVEDLLHQNSLVETQSRFHLGGPIIEIIDEIPTSAHTNIRAGASVVPVRNRQTGEIIGHVAGGPKSGFTNIGGQRHKVIAHSKKGIVVSSAPKAKDGDKTPVSVKYPTVPFLIARQYCREVAKGLGLPDDAAPLVDGVWWHFGGQAVEKLLRLRMPQVFVGSALNGIALRVTGDVSIAKTLFDSAGEINEALDKVVLSARSRYSRSSFDDFLSADVFAKVAAEALQPSALFKFLASRQIFHLEDSDPIKARILSLMA